jgi:hypothetical protein
MNGEKSFEAGREGITKNEKWGSYIGRGVSEVPGNLGVIPRWVMGAKGCKPKDPSVTQHRMNEPLTNRTSFSLLCLVKINSCLGSDGGSAPVAIIV